MNSKAYTQQEAGDELDTRAKEYQAANPGTSYTDAIRAALASDRALKAAYIGVEDVLPEEVELIDTQDVRAEVDTKVKAFMAQHPGTNYTTAMVRVFETDPVLKTRYAQS